MKTKNIIILLAVVVTAVFITVGCESDKVKVPKSSNGKYDYLVLVNKYSQLPDDWEKNVELVDAKNAWDEDIKIEKQAYEQYKKLAKDLKENDKVEIVLDSVYRSVKDQQDLWDEWSADPEKGIEYVKKFVAVPGYSEHHTGLAVKIHAKLADYGFILRYKEGREDSTGYTYEPWHLRYVGSKEIAKEIADKDITFEEYLADIKDKNSVESASIYQVEQTLMKELKDGSYKDKISDIKFNVTKIYTLEEKRKDNNLQSLDVQKNDIAFEVTYRIQPVEGVDIQELTAVDGEYNEATGYIENISRLGVLKYDSKKNSYKLWK